MLEDVVSDYCKKNPTEDKAETARYFMSNLADSLVQAATRPELAGSQRILHVLGKYKQALASDGPGVDWFVQLALGRTETAPRTEPPAMGAPRVPAVAPLGRVQPHRQAGCYSIKPANPYIGQVDSAVTDPQVRAAIKQVQPACVRAGRGSGVNISANGRVLTASHVPSKLGAELSVTFPDGREYAGTCTAIDQRLDLAVLSLATTDKLPFAPLAKAPPETGTKVVCIGQPGSLTPAGKPTGYGAFHVSTGAIRGFLDDPLGNQSLGRTKHDAWTYWGHSGSPLFNEAGQIVARAQQLGFNHGHAPCGDLPGNHRLSQAREDCLHGRTMNSWSLVIGH